MKVNIKNLKGEIFSIEMDPALDVVVSSLKERIETEKGFSKDSMKIIFKGKTIKDEEQLDKLGIKQTDFLVVMNQVSKPPPKPKVEEKPNEPKQENPQNQQQKQPEKKENNSNPPSTQPSENQVNELMAMGFPREQCLAALNAAFGNSDRAVQYLLNGIPQSPIQGQPGASNLMSSLQNMPQLNELRTMLQNDPSSLPQILQQIGQTSPDLYNLIMQHPDEFENILQGGEMEEDGEYIEGEEGEGGEGEIVVTQQEQAAINRLSALGFSKIEAAQAYMACDKNEQLAANLLFERLANGDIEHSGQSYNEGDEDDDNLFN